ncbi:Glu-tRNA(Gln) amidotransferase subunit GatE [Cuniculiplasma divulgatum]|uniref:Glutamyl-tRNA(Gln) amidotransferase subunit E n=1 Tax=Cuniculiplasma divulgatum TaxID=1673428 RepID=A0A1R4A958_9ARCH|nr:Glu-tRNA(Gln) amidotransferase subunit GatE [Cuniculiplasma divulgatum]SJK85495.1 glutamyl-tRNA(Gln) amidotransferase subunit E [Cuniculiplasma divulgatum]
MVLPDNTMIGLEVHMQIDVGKLFCRCNSEGQLLEESFVRRLHSSSGEIGSKDISTYYEEARDRLFKYIVSENSCLVEADEEPPLEINRKALKAALAMSMAFSSSIMDRVSVMRKVVIDGSNTSGFQRTSLIGIGGEIKSGKAKAGITTICLEEDSCRKVEEKANIVVYSLDRLGLPLIEISTSPDMKSAEDAMSIAREIGNRMLVMGLLRKGADAIRQDVNFSMGYGRVEIKGVSKLSAFREILENEADRQKWLAEAVKRVKANGGFEKLEFSDVTPLLTDTDSKIIWKGLNDGKKIYATKLANFRGVMKTDHFRFGREIADALKPINIKGVIHYEELPAYGLTINERDTITEYFSLKDNDSFLLLITEPDKVQDASKVIEERIEKLLSLDFSETRAALEDNTTRYMRPLSGSSRMYPETDIPVIKIDEQILEEASEEIPEGLESFTNSISRKYGISIQDAETIISDGKLEKFTLMANEKNGKVLSRIINQTIPEMNKKYGKEVSWEQIQNVIGFCIKNSLGRYSMERAIDMLYSGNSVKEILNPNLLKPVSEESIMNLIKKCDIDVNSNMADILRKLNSMNEGVIDPSIVARLINTVRNKDSN